jgi:hypothetical protein
MPKDLQQRDFIGYGPNPPNPQWPNNAKLAINFVLNYEEGGENSVMNGDDASEVFLNEVQRLTRHPAEDRGHTGTLTWKLSSSTGADAVSGG